MIDFTTLLGDSPGVKFFQKFVIIANLWDDLIDKDKEITDVEVINAFTILLTTYQSDPFFLTHQDALLPTIGIACQNYKISVELEQASCFQVSYTLRLNYLSLLLQILTIEFGADRAEQCLLELYKSHTQDSFDNYVKEFSAEKIVSSNYKLPISDGNDFGSTFQTALKSSGLQLSKDMVEVISLLCNTLHLWDDIIDKDKNPSNTFISECFYNCLVLLPKNKLYSTYRKEITSILICAILNWHTATAWERENSHLEIAFILRSSYVDLVSFLLATQLSLADTAKIVPLLREAAHHEGFEKYLTNLAKEKELRNVL